MKLLLTSDWHLDAVTAGVARERELVGAVNETLQAAEQAHVDAYVFEGDLTDPDTPGSHAAVGHAVGAACRLHGAGIPSRWMTGNHCVIENGQLHHVLLAIKHLSCVDALVIDQPQREVLKQRDGDQKLDVAYLPFTPRSHSYDPVTWVEASVDAKVRAVFGHLNIEGITPGSETTEMARGRDVFYPTEALKRLAPEAWLSNGHYHREQTHDGIYIPGALARLSFGEEGYELPGFAVVEFRP